MSVNSSNTLYRESLITIHNKKGDKILRQLRHFFIYNWVDRATVTEHNAQHLEDLLKKVSSLRTSKPKQPVLVHCSAGIGRTGTFVALHMAIQEIIKQRENSKVKKFQPDLKIYDIVFRLRHMRPFMVQTPSQYLFIHKFMKRFI